MTINEWYLTRQGQSLLVPGASPADRGQCMQAWDYGLNEVYGLTYVWANAIDCWNNFENIPQLRDNFDKITDGSVRTGDTVVFNTTVGSVFGHIDWALQDGTTNDFIGADSNWSGDKTLHEVHHTRSQYVLGSLRFKQGDTMTQEQAEKIALYERLLSGLNEDDAKKYVANDVAYMNQGNVFDQIGQLLENSYNSKDFQQMSYKSAHYDADVAAAGSKGFTKLSEDVYTKDK